MALHWLLSIDPGTHSAWVLWEQVAPGRWSPIRVGRETAPSVRECLDVLGGLLPTWCEAAVVVENQFYVPKRGFSPWNDVATLIEIRCRWQHAGEIARAAQVEVVAPGRWIPAMTKGAPGGTSKDRIRWTVSQLLPTVPLAGDEYDAAGLGAWWVREQGGTVGSLLAMPAEAV